MNTKEAIDKTLPGSEMSYEGAISLLQHLQKKELNYNSQGILWAIKLLQRGEKFEAMWEELKELDRYGSCPASGAWIIDYQEIEKLEQKYFPKEVTNE